MNAAKSYTATDIERYHSGQLSAAECHALEKAALDDPFLADALEGYVYTNTPKADLNAVGQRLQLRLAKNKKRTGLFFLANNWMKVAALLILIAGGGLIMSRLFSTKESTMAIKQAPLTQPLSPAQRMADSTPLSSGAPAVAQAPPLQKAKASKQEDAYKNDLVEQKAPVAGSSHSLPAAPGLTVPDSAKDLGYAARSAAPFEADKAGALFKKTAGDDAERKGRDETAKTDTIKNFNVTLKQTELSPQETVTLNHKARERSQANRMNIIVDSLEPAEGWTNFDDYVADHLKEPEEIKTKGIKGDVELSFDTNKEGEPVNITVTQSLCNRCDEEAVRLLKEGPKWKKNKKKGKIKIKFSAP